jgi:hypothetical protein
VSEFDSPWKDVLDQYFEAFVAFFFPKIHRAVDWSRGFETLDKELQQVMADAETGRRYVDKLVKVWRSDGVEEWVLVHIEVQHSNDSEFTKRMFVYYYRLLDRYDRKVASLAVLGDDNANWLPDRYNAELWDCSVEFRFPSVKLLGWASQTDALERDANPFAVVVLADLKARETKKDPVSRKEWKFRIVRGLFERGMSREDIRKLFRFIDWVMDLPEPLAIEFDNDLHAYEQEKHMPYVTGMERRAIERGKIEGEIASWQASTELQLDHKFGAAGLALMPLVRKMDDPAKLKELQKAILTASAVEEVAALLS